MTKIIKLDGEEVLLGTDDGKIRKVRIYDLHFAPMVGDEVEIYESDGNVVVTKKEGPQVTTSPNPANTNYQPTKSDNLRIFLYIAMLASIAACFLPIVSISILGYTVSINYIYNEGSVADGIFIIIFQIIAMICLAKNKKTTVCVLEILAAGIFGITAYNLFTRVSKSISISISNYLGIGFYVLLISLVLGIVLAFVNARKD